MITCFSGIHSSPLGTFLWILRFCTVLKVNLLVIILFCYALLVENLIEEGTFLDMFLTSRELVRFFYIVEFTGTRYYFAV